MATALSAMTAGAIPGNFPVNITVTPPLGPGRAYRLLVSFLPMQPGNNNPTSNLKSLYRPIESYNG